MRENTAELTKHEDVLANAALDVDVFELDNRIDGMVPEDGGCPAFS
jgi:hypothetical protein